MAVDIDFEALDAQHGLPWGTTRAVAQAESNMNPRAVSPVGAQGLMQIMPGTAGDLGLKDPFDPVANAQAGSKYLGQLYKRYGGDIEKAFAAYNFGMGNIDKGRALPEETRNYVPKVVGNQMDFLEQRVFGGQPAQGGQEVDLDALEQRLFGGEPRGQEIDLDALEQTLFGARPDWQSAEDVPAGTDINTVQQGRDPDVPLPGGPSEYEVREPGMLDAVPQALRRPVSPAEGPAYLNLIPPSARGDVEPLVRGAMAPIQADMQMWAQRLPDSLERKLLGGKTILEQQQEAEAGYQSRRLDPNATDWARITGNIASSLPLALLPLPGTGVIGGAVKGAALAGTQPVQDARTDEDVASGKAMQALVGGGIGAAVPAAGTLINLPRRIAHRLSPRGIAEEIIKLQREAAKTAPSPLQPARAAAAPATIPTPAPQAPAATTPVQRAQEQAARVAAQKQVAGKAAVEAATPTKGATKDVAKITAKTAAGKVAKEREVKQRASIFAEKIGERAGKTLQEFTDEFNAADRAYKAASKAKDDALRRFAPAKEVEAAQRRLTEASAARERALEAQRGALKGAYPQRPSTAAPEGIPAALRAAPQPAAPSAGPASLPSQPSPAGGRATSAAQKGTTEARSVDATDELQAALKALARARKRGAGAAEISQIQARIQRAQKATQAAGR